MYRKYFRSVPFSIILLKDFSMPKKTKHQGNVDLITEQNLNQHLNHLLKKGISASMPKMLRRLLGTAAFLALISVKIGGGGG
jgi:hypothetical protein